MVTYVADTPITPYVLLLLYQIHTYTYMYINIHTHITNQVTHLRSLAFELT